MLPNARIKNIIQKKTARIRYSTGCKNISKMSYVIKLQHFSMLHPRSRSRYSMSG